MKSPLAQSGEEHTAQCPRCGYDLRGTTATWTASCPIGGRCTECGYGFEWGELLSERRRVLPWCVEHVEPRALPRGMVGTFIRSWLPWRFWVQLRLAHPFRPMRLMVYVLLLMLVPIVPFYLGVQSTVAVMARGEVQRELNENQQRIPLLIVQTEQTRAQWAELREKDIAEINAGLYGDFAGLIGYRPPFESPEEWSAYWQEWDANLENALEQLDAARQAAPRVRHSYPMAILEAVLLPWRDISYGSVEFHGQTYPYPAPRELHEFLAERWRGTWQARSVVVEFSGALQSIGGLLLLTVLFMVLFPVTFILLPITRRRAKVRWRHFARVTAYSCFIPAATLWFSATLAVCSTLGLGPSTTLRQLALLSTIALPLPMLCGYGGSSPYASTCACPTPSGWWRSCQY